MTVALAKSFVSHVQIFNGWYIAAPSPQVKRRLVAQTILDTPLVLFRDAQGTARAVLDRCPHRNVPLSMGRVENGALICGYHGWRFDGDGRCLRVPGLPEGPLPKACHVRAYPTVEQDGFIWVWMGEGAADSNGPFRFPEVDSRGWTTVRRTLRADASMFAVIENTLDVPHTAYLHRGLFRSNKSVHFDVTVSDLHNGVEAKFEGEKAPSGLVGRLLARGGGTLVHFDRFLLPCIAQVEYGLGKYRLYVTSAHTPVSASQTEIHVLVTFRLPLPAWLAKLVISPVAGRIWQQDAKILAAQTRSTQAFGGEQFVSTRADLLGPRVLRLMKEAERGEVHRAAPPESAELFLS